MGVQKLSKVAIFGSKNKKQILLEELQKTGLVQIILESDSTQKKTMGSDSALKKLNELLPVLESKVKESFMEKNGIKYVTETDFFEGQKNDFTKNITMLQNAYANLKDLRNAHYSLNELNSLLKELTPWQSLNISLEGLKQSTAFSIFVGSITPDVLSLFMKNKLAAHMDYDVISATKEMLYCVFLLQESHKKEVLDHLKIIGATEYTPIAGVTNKSTAELYIKTKEKIDFTTNEINILEAKLQEYTNYLAHFRLFHDYLTNEVEKDIASSNAHETEFTFMFKAYIAKKNIPLLEKLLTSIKAVDFEEVEIQKDEVVPSLIQNNRFAQSFEFVTNMYSLPGKHDPDPTPFFAPFFALFMGFCIGDAGQGLLLSLVSLFMIKKLKISKSIKKLMQICFYGGIAAIFIGIITGSYFAIPFASMGVKIPKLYDPAEQIMLALGIAIGLGFVHVLLGFIVKTWYLWVTGDKLASIFDGFSKVLVMFGGLLVTLGFSIKTIHFLVPVGTYTALAGATIILFTSGRHEGESIFGKLMWGFYGVYELTGIFGDLLSYARLFALGLSGGIIGNAINTLAPRLLVGINFHGITSILYALIMILVFLLILIGGHLFTMMLAILSGFIHTMRLQFVEFFTKFFEGGGEPFTPFNIQSKYFWIKQSKKKSK